MRPLSCLPVAPLPREQQLNRRLPTQLHLHSLEELVSTEDTPPFEGEGTPDELWNHRLDNFFVSKLADMVRVLSSIEIRSRLSKFASTFDSDKELDAHNRLAALGLEVPQPPALPPTPGRGETAGAGGEGDGGGEVARPRGRGATAKGSKRRRLNKT